MSCRLYSFSAPPPGVPGPIQPPQIENTFGALLLGHSLLACTLYGLTTHQAYRYFRLYQGDAWYLKFLVRTSLLDTIHTIMIMHFCYFYLVLGYFNPIQLEDGTWSVRTSVAMLNNIFYIWKVYICRHILCCLYQAVSAFARLDGLTLAALIINFVSDLIISGSIAYLLRLRRTGNNGTDSIIDTLILYSINAGLLTGYENLPGYLICMPANLVYLAIQLLLSKLYANSMLAVLNSRYSLRDRGAEGFEMGALDLQTSEPSSSAWEIPPPRARRNGGSRSVHPVIDIRALQVTESVKY
ncbi:hypothetical protein BD779DRAFT_1552186 [Infundibulicybe gibba]|nr:hypothetical protein BD779DRAFT_1552186 [Infundibulicybe gibba]